MFFLTLSVVDIDFLDWELRWRTYTIQAALSTTRRVKLVGKKEFAAAAFDPKYETYVVHVGLGFRTSQVYWDQQLFYWPSRRPFKSSANAPILFIHKDGNLWLYVWGWPSKAGTLCLGLRLYSLGQSVNSDRRRLLLAIHPKISRIAIPFILILNILRSIDSTTRLGKGRVGVDGDGVDDDGDCSGNSDRKFAS